MSVRSVLGLCGLLWLMNGCQQHVDSQLAGEQTMATVSGVLSLYLNRGDTRGLFVRFVITPEDASEIIADSGFLAIDGQPIKFSLDYSPQRIKADAAYRLKVFVVEDPHGNRFVLSADFAVLAPGQPSELNLVIKQTPTPLE